MPVIQSVDGDNTMAEFYHCAAFYVNKSNVHFKGLRFVGNPNSGVHFYYPINRLDETLDGLEVSQCLFTSDMNFAPIQAGVWAYGAGIKVDHCIFSNCRNALVAIKSIRKFSLTHCIVSGALEAAIWFGAYLEPFTVRDNIITNCAYFLVGDENATPAYSFGHLLLSGNQNYLGYHDKVGNLFPLDDHNVRETDLRRSGKVRFVKVEDYSIPRDQFNLTSDSDGRDLGAGLFASAGVQ